MKEINDLFGIEIQERKNRKLSYFVPVLYSRIR